MGETGERAGAVDPVVRPRQAPAGAAGNGAGDQVPGGAAGEGRRPSVAVEPGVDQGERLNRPEFGRDLRLWL
ncbi:hypothetical protein ACWGLG_39195 [Streptomyces antimycoticus]